MKTLHLIRHSIASNGFPDAADIDRPLSDRGEAVCKTMARKIYTAGCSFENVFASPAIRAQSTIRLIGESIDEKSIDWTIEDKLYTFAWPELLGWLESRDNDQDAVVIVGHNPAISELAIFLTGDQIAQVPPCTYLQICAYIGRWSDLYRECGNLVEIVFPPN